jgi:asparagine synthase (glutamine-hydrolysing)
MCGIAGIIATGPSQLQRADLARLAAAIAHRGPDGEGIWVSPDGTAGLVHRRLAIIDTSDRGHQPMHTPDRQWSVVYNGEVYNFLELRSELEALGSRFFSDSDTEVILEAWRHWGPDMLKRFNGMWALAIRDNRSGDVFFARDRFGIKPLLYAHAGGRFAFASEMRALKALAWVNHDIDTRVAARLMFDPFGIEGGEATLHQGIRRLPAGHCAWLKGGRFETRRWWITTEHLVAVPANPAERVERFRELFLDAVRIRMRSDVSVGTCLSGGFDSSAIACAMAHVAQDTQPHAREARDWRHAFIASFPGQSNDETPEALEAAQYASVTPHVLRFDQQDPLAAIDQVMGDLDDVYISLTTAPWQIYRELRSARTLVSLDGHGADELMGAYLQEGKSLGFSLRNQAERWAQGSPLAQRALDSAKLTALSSSGLNFLRQHRFVAPDAMHIPFDADDLPTHWGPLNRRLYRMFHSTVLPTILRNFDRLSMAHGIEVRMPFMDWRVVTYVMSLPDADKLHDGRNKWVARRAMADLMPERIRMARRKVGFNSPMPEWLNSKAMQPWLSNLLSRPNDVFEALVDVRALRNRVEALTLAGQWNWQNAGRLWPYINLKWVLDTGARH